MEPSHPIIISRLAGVFLCALPAVRELYQYLNHPECVIPAPQLDYNTQVFNQEGCSHGPTCLALTGNRCESTIFICIRTLFNACFSLLNFSSLSNGAEGCSLNLSRLISRLLGQLAERSWLRILRSRYVYLIHGLHSIDNTISSLGCHLYGDI